MSGITTANLTDTGNSGTRSPSPAGPGRRDAQGLAQKPWWTSCRSSVVLTNTSLAVTGLPTLTLGGFTTANLTDTAGGNTFTVSGWTGIGSLTDSAATGDTVTASKSAGFTLTNTVLSSTDGMTLGLSGITTANLTDTGSKHTFTVTGWTGSGTLKGSTETLVDVVSSSVVLANASLAVTGLPTLTLSGFTTANLTDTAGGNTFTVSGWTGSGSLTDSAAAGDTVTASKSAGYTLTNTSLSSTDGMALGLERHHDRQPRCHQCQQDVHSQRLDGERVADRHGDGHRHGEQERRLHSDQHVADVHRRHDARLERDHDRQPHRHRHQAATRFTITGWTGKATLDRFARTPWWTRWRRTPR